MMAVAAWLVWRQGGFVAQRQPLVFFLVQLALNALWAPLFFGLHQPGIAFVELMVLWLAIPGRWRYFANPDPCLISFLHKGFRTADPINRFAMRL